MRGAYHDCYTGHAATVFIRLNHAPHFAVCSPTIAARTAPQRPSEPASAGLRDWQFAVGPEAVGPSLHRLVIDQATSIDVSQAFQRQLPASVGTGRIPGIGLTGESALPLRLGFGPVGVVVRVWDRVHA